MPELYREQGNNPKYHAQRNLQGRTHYVDDDTLRFHKAEKDDANGPSVCRAYRLRG